MKSISRSKHLLFFSPTYHYLFKLSGFVWSNRWQLNSTPVQLLDAYSFPEAILHIHANFSFMTTFLIKMQISHAVYHEVYLEADKSTPINQSLAKNGQNYTWEPNYGSFYPRLIWNDYLLFSACFETIEVVRDLICKGWNYQKLKISLTTILALTTFLPFAAIFKFAFL